MGKIVSVTVVDLTAPIVQAGFKAVGLFDFTSDIEPSVITDTSTLTAGTKLLEFASVFFANGGGSLLVAGKSPSSAEDVFSFLNSTALDYDFYGVNVIVPKASQKEYLEQVKLFVDGATKLSLVEVNGTVAEVEDALDGLNSSRIVAYANSNNEQNGMASAVSGLCFPQEEGSLSWGNNSITSITSSKYSTGDEISLLSENINYLTDEGGLVLSQMGRTLSGSNADITRSKDYLNNRLSEALTATLVNAKKIGFVTSDLGKIVTAMDEVGVVAVNQGMLESFYSVVPSVASIPTNDKANRVLRGVKFIATLSGAVETLELELQIKL